MILLPLFFLAYIVVWVGLVIGIGVISWRSSKSVIGTGVAVAITFFAMYWPAFGDYFPTVNAHKEYCEKEAGFKIYVTPEQWAAENPGILETLSPYEKFTPYQHMVMGNERFAMKFEMQLIEGAVVRRGIETILDIKTQKVLAEKIDFNRGYRYYDTKGWRTIKMWLDKNSCYSSQEIQENNTQINDFFKKIKIARSN